MGDLSLSPDAVTLTRHGSRGRRQEWRDSPHWARPVLHPAGGPVPDYLTLQGGPREVELAAFLAPDERRALAGELRTALTAMR